MENVMTFEAPIIRGDYTNSIMPIPFKDTDGNIIGQINALRYDGTFTIAKFDANVSAEVFHDDLRIRQVVVFKQPVLLATSPFPILDVMA
jgi:hypothetical protein